MTLIITTLADDAITQAADMRLTFPDGNIASDKAVKTIYFVASDARLLISYTGLARLGLGSSAKPTDKWLVDFLTTSEATTKRLPDVIDELQKQAAKTFSAFKSWGQVRAITFVVTGFGPPGPFVVLISNQEDGHGKRLKTLNDTFEVGWYFRNDKKMRKLAYATRTQPKSINSRR